MDTPHVDDRTSTPPHGDEETQGISNRETAAQEERERKDHPPVADEEPQSRPHRAPSREKK
jgi:hypothetical protein